MHTKIASQRKNATRQRPTLLQHREHRMRGELTANLHLTDGSAGYCRCKPEREEAERWLGWGVRGNRNTHSRSQPHTANSSIPACGRIAVGGISGAGGLKKGKRERENSLWGREKYCAQVTWLRGNLVGRVPFPTGVPSLSGMF